MLEFKDNPQKLMQALDRFLSVYFDNRQEEYKPDLDEIATWNIPQPLKDLYLFAGKYPGKHGHPLSSQDTLMVNSGKGKTYGGKIVIVGENQGVWNCFTDTKGEDPSVWIGDENYEWNDDFPIWKLVNNSLSQFLVTFYMQEAIFASRYLYGGNFEAVIPSLRQEGYKVSTLWQGKYVWDDYFERCFKDRDKFINFYSVEDAILISSRGWYGTNYKNANRLLTSISPEFTKINKNSSLLTM